MEKVWPWASGGCRRLWERVGASAGADWAASRTGRPQRREACRWSAPHRAQSLLRGHISPYPVRDGAGRSPSAWRRDRDGRRGSGASAHVCQVLPEGAAGGSELIFPASVREAPPDLRPPERDRERQTGHSGPVCAEVSAGPEAGRIAAVRRGRLLRPVSPAPLEGSAAGRRARRAALFRALPDGMRAVREGAAGPF